MKSVNVNQLPAEIKRRIPSAAVPVHYEEAIKSLVACRSIDEAKYWDDKAEALAAWAKIFKSDQAAIEAKRLKLHAYRRMSELAELLRPNRYHKEGRAPGPPSILMEKGISRNQASRIRMVGSLPQRKFESLVARKDPPSITKISSLVSHCTEAWVTFARGDHGSGGGFSAVSTFIRKHSARDLACSINPEEAIKAREIVRNLSDWLDEFEQHLPKVKAK